MEKVAAVANPRQRSSSLTNQNGKTPQYEVNEEEEYSDSEEEKEDGDEKDKTTKDGVKEKEKTTKEKEIQEKQEIKEKEKKDKIPKENVSEYSDEDDSSDGVTEVVGDLEDCEKSVNPILNNVSNLSSRQRSASVSPHAARPVLDFDDVVSGKISPHHTKSASQKKRSQTPQKTKRPTVLSEELFKPPPEHFKEEPKLNNLSEVQGSMNLIPENISAKPLEQIVDEVVRVLSKEDIKYRKRKNKYIWKCTGDIGRETVQLELEIMNVKNSMCGIMVRRIQGSFPCYQELYQRIKKELKI